MSSRAPGRPARERGVSSRRRSARRIAQAMLYTSDFGPLRYSVCPRLLTAAQVVRALRSIGGRCVHAWRDWKGRVVVDMELPPPANMPRTQEQVAAALERAGAKAGFDEAEPLYFPRGKPFFQSIANVSDDFLPARASQRQPDREDL